MFDDARFYSRLAENSQSYGKVSADENRMYLRISALDFDNDLLAAIDCADEYLVN